MRQLASQVFGVTATGTPQKIVRTWVPANSWGEGKVVLTRCRYLFTLPAGGFPPLYNVQESILTSQTTLYNLPAVAAFVPAAGAFATVIQRLLMRDSGSVYAFDLGDTMAARRANNYAAGQVIQPLPHPGGPWDFTQEIWIDQQALLPLTIPGATLVGKWSEAFLEQATNLGKLP